MKKLILLAISVVVLTASCTKDGPQGIQGLDGAVGATGPQGIPGVDGQDATVACTQCHNSSATIVPKQMQCDSSIHKEGTTYFETGTSCAGCHTNEGFNETMKTGSANTLATVGEPTPVGCYTCHKIHSAYDTNDYALKTTSTFNMRFGGVAPALSTTPMPDQQKANLCVRCHQSRPMSGIDTIVTASTIDTRARKTSSTSGTRFGPHYGPQGNMVAGVSAFIFDGVYTASAHSGIQNTCIKCHMSTLVHGSFAPNAAGGHTCRVASHNGTINNAGCTGCHSNGNATFTAYKATFSKRMDSLEVILANPAKLLADTVLKTALNNTTMTAEQAKVVYNYVFLSKDKSYGAHNPIYADLLLTKSLERARNW